MVGGRNLTTGDIRKNIISLAVPMVLAQMCQQLYQLTDTMIVGRFIGEGAMASVGACSPFVFLFIAMSKGIAIGSSIVVSQNYGRGDTCNVRKASESLYLFMVLFGLLMTFTVSLFIDDIIKLIGLPEELIPSAIEYFSVYIYGLTFVFLFNSITSLYKGIGDSKTPLKFVIASVILNIGLDLLFVVFFEMGVRGAALATVISQGLAVVSLFIYANRNESVIGCRWLKARLHKKIFSESLKLGLPSGFQQIFVSVGMVAIMSVVNSFGVDVIAGYVAASRIEVFLMVIPINIGSALTSFVAQNYGSGNFDRIDKSIKESLKMMFIVCFVVLIMLSAFGTPLMQIFTDNANIINVGNQYLFIIGLTFVIFSIMFVYMGALIGVGNTIVPMFITLLSLWVLKIPMAYILSDKFNEIGIWLASPISWLLGLTASILFWYSMRKKLEKRSS